MTFLQLLTSVTRLFWPRSKPAVKAKAVRGKAKATLADRHRELRGRFRALQSKYDAAVTNDDNVRHWANADGLSAALANNPAVRQTLRGRSRYEHDNGGHMTGMIRTRADDLVGTGATLQIISDDDDTADGETPGDLVEKRWAAWCKATGLWEKLHTMDQAECRDGEAFAVLQTNPNVADPVKLDLLPVEAERVADPTGFASITNLVAPRKQADGTQWLDGIQYDSFGNPLAYTILEEYPDERTWAAEVPSVTVKARWVVHSFRKDRPGQLRGVPEMVASLPLFPYLRRWTLATVSAAETAASYAAMLETEAPDDSDADDDAEDPLRPFETVPIERNMLAVAPSGAKMHQFEAKHPNATHKEFKRELLKEGARPLSMPVNVATADSSDHNFSSAKLDHYGYRSAIRVRRSFRNDAILEKIFLAWADEGRQVPGYFPDGVDVAAMERVWAWPGWQSMDKDEASQDSERLENMTASLAEILGEWGIDWKSNLKRRARELKMMKRLGIIDILAELNKPTPKGTAPPGQPPSNAAPPARQAAARNGNGVHP